jgi:hypothetical protein
MFTVTMRFSDWFEWREMMQNAYRSYIYDYLCDPGSQQIGGVYADTLMGCCLWE